MIGSTRRGFIAGLAGGAGLLAVGGCRTWRGARAEKFALNASTLRGYNLGLVDQIRAAASAGFGGFEPWLKDLHAAKVAGRLGDAVRLAGDAGIEFVNGIAFGKWAASDAATRAQGLEEMRRDMAILSEIGCPRIAASMYGMQTAGSPILSTDEIVDRYAAVCELGERMGVEPLLEYWGHSINLSTPEQALEVVRRLNRGERPILADVYHTYRGGSGFASFAKFSAKTLPVLHVNDYPLDRPRSALVDADRVWAGEGAAPWEEIFANLAAGGADPWLSVEVFNPNYWKSTPEATARAAMGSLRKLTAERRDRKLRLGVQMWSVNDLWKDDSARALRRLKAMGYDGVQSGGFYEMDWNELEKMLDGEGLEIVDMPFHMKTLEGDGEKRFLEFCRRFKIGFAFEAWWKGDTADKWRGHAEELKAVRERFAAAGLRTGYHNHQYEFRPLADGSRPIDIIEAAKVDFELDVGHTRLAGDDPMEWLKRLVGRVPSIHAKPAGGNAIGGAGDVNDWRAIFGAAKSAGAKWAIVECEQRRNTYDDVAESMKYIRDLI